MSQKQCTKCAITKPLNAFHKRRDVPNGYNSWCKTCRSDYFKTRRSKKSVYDRNRREAKRDEINEKQRKNYAENIERYRKASRNYYRNNKLKICENYAEKMLTVKARANKILGSARRSAPKRGLSFNITRADVENLLSLGRCMKSGVRLDMGPNNGLTNPFGPSLDRIDNSKGYERGNIQIVCYMFNTGKTHTSEVDFLALCSAVHLMQGYRPEVIERVKELMK